MGVFLTCLLLAELQQVSVWAPREQAGRLAAASQELGGVSVCPEGEPDRGLLCLRGGGTLHPLYSKEDEHSGGFFKQLFNLLVSEATELDVTLLETGRRQFTVTVPRGISLSGVTHLVFVPLRGADHGAELGEQEVDGIWVLLFGP